MPFIQHDNRRVLFVHIPKTAGTSVLSWLEGIAPLHMRTTGQPAALKCTPQHLRMSDITALFGEGYFDYAFAISRNPYTRMESEYRMQVEAQGFFKRPPAFSLWLENHLRRASQDMWHKDNHFRPQWDFIGSSVDVFRLEDGLDQILSTVASRANLPAPDSIDTALKTDETAIPVTWDEVDRMRVQEFYARDFKRFGYDPEAF